MRILYLNLLHYSLIQIKLLVIEKKLPINGGFPYLHKGGEEGYEEQRAVRDKMKELPKIGKD